jgi:CheY-like chemotaxis protein
MGNTGATDPGAQAVILIAEDNEDDVLFLRRAFAKAGFGKSVVFVRDGDEVIKYLTHQPPFDDPALCPAPAVLLLDARMPKMDGLDVLLWLRNHPEIGPFPALLFTSGLTPQQQDHAVKLGAIACLEKPTAPNGWYSIVEHVKAFQRPSTPN